MKRPLDDTQIMHDLYQWLVFSSLISTQQGKLVSSNVRTKFLLEYKNTVRKNSNVVYPDWKKIDDDIWRVTLQRA